MYVNDNISEISCDPPFVPTNGKAKVKKVSVFGSFVTFTCDIGYILEGPKSLHCLASGNWNGTEPECKGVLNHCT